MRHLTSFLLISLLSISALLSAPEAEARGGRFAGPASAAAPSARDVDRPGDDYADVMPPPPGPAPVPLPEGGVGVRRLPRTLGQLEDGDASGGGRSAGGMDASGGAQGGGAATAGATGRKRGAGKAAPTGPADWTYWYDANREEFEDLRRGAFITEANPLFALGAADTVRSGPSEHRLGENARTALLEAVRGALRPDDSQWVYTRGAAYIALAKIASTPAEVEALYQGLDSRVDETQFVRESAALALGQLRRTEARRQLAGTTLDRARDALRAVLADSRAAPRTRSFAALSLGLLSDQPSAEKRIGRRTSDLLLKTWMKQDLADETQVGLLMGLGLHRPEEVSAVTRLALQGCLLRGRIGSRKTSTLVRAQAVLALGRLGTRMDAASLAKVLTSRHLPSPALRQAVAIAAGVLGSRVPEVRLQLAYALDAAYALSRDPAGRHVSLMALGRILASAAGTADETLVKDALITKRMLGAAKAGDVGERTFGALALGLAARNVDESVEAEAWQAFRAASIESLRAGFADFRLSGHARAAFATALGLVRDSGSRNRLLRVLEDQGGDPELRAYAALGLGLLGTARHDVLKAVSVALADTRSDALRIRAATALGLLGGGGAKEREKTLAILMTQLEATREQRVKGQIAITLARIGDARSVGPLIRMLKGAKEPHMNRAMACAALGLLGDEERTPVLSEARRDAHYLGGASVVYEILDVL